MVACNGVLQLLLLSHLAHATDAVTTTPATILVGANTDDRFGRVAGGGDFDGDGYADVLVGAGGFEAGTGFGRVYVYMGSASGLSSSAAQTLDGATNGTGYADDVSVVGDVNGDTYDDVLVGAAAYDGSTGQVYLYLGSATGLSSTPDATLTGGAVGDQFGDAVSGAGDVDDDGYDDVIIGAYEYGSRMGAAYVIHGSAGGLETTATTTLVGLTVDAYFAYSVSGAGDVDGDGYDDVIVGALGSYDNTGRAFVYLGSASGVETTAATTLTGTMYVDFGLSVSDAGDVNGDGYGDVIVGEDINNPDVGHAYVYAGSASGVSTTPESTLAGETPSDSFGVSVSSAGDVDGDGFDDVIVGASGYDTVYGRAYVFVGSASGVSTTPTVLDHGSTYFSFGASVSCAGDVNADGLDDVIVGAPGYRSLGYGLVYHGFALAEDADGDGYTTDSDCDDTTASTFPGAVESCDGIDNNCDGQIDEGVLSTWYADVDGDGYTDPAVTATGCTAPMGFAAATETDCDDADPQSHPGAADTPDDGIDQDCVGGDEHGGDTDTHDTADTDTHDTADTDTDDTADTDVGDTDAGDDSGNVDTTPDTGCGCSTGARAQLGWAVALLTLGGARRRPRPPAPTTHRPPGGLGRAA